MRIDSWKMLSVFQIVPVDQNIPTKVDHVDGSGTGIVPGNYFFLEDILNCSRI